MKDSLSNGPSSEPKPFRIPFSIASRIFLATAIGTPLLAACIPDSQPSIYTISLTSQESIVEQLGRDFRDVPETEIHLKSLGGGLWKPNSARLTASHPFHDMGDLTILTAEPYSTYENQTWKALIFVGSERQMKIRNIKVSPALEEFDADHLTSSDQHNLAINIGLEGTGLVPFFSKNVIDDFNQTALQQVLIERVNNEDFSVIPGSPRLYTITTKTRTP
jgi:hypothetical protein